jgi:hypothetical protein
MIVRALAWLRDRLRAAAAIAGYWGGIVMRAPVAFVRGFRRH